MFIVAEKTRKLCYYEGVQKLQLNVYMTVVNFPAKFFFELFV